MALTPINSELKPGHSGKGMGIGGIAGGVIGGILGAIGGAGAGGVGAIPGAIGGASAGMAAGGTVGNQIDPSRAAEAGLNSQLIESSNPQKTVPLERFENNPEVQLANLQSAREALRSEQSIPTPQAQLLDKDFAEAQKLLKNRVTVSNV